MLFSRLANPVLKLAHGSSPAILAVAGAVTRDSRFARSLVGAVVTGSVHRVLIKKIVYVGHDHAQRDFSVDLSRRSRRRRASC